MRSTLSCTRLAAFAAFLLWILVSPIYGQLLGGKSPLIRRWTMFSSRGSDICAAKFFLTRGSDTRQQIDRLAVLGHASKRLAHPSVRWLSTPSAIEFQARILCSLLGGDIKVEARCGSERGWIAVLDPQVNYCAQMTFHPHLGKAHDD